MLLPVAFYPLTHFTNTDSWKSSFTSFHHNCNKEILNKIEFLNPIPSSKKVVKYFFYPVTVNGGGDGKIIHRAFLLNDLAKFESIFITVLHLLASPV